MTVGPAHLNTLRQLVSALYEACDTNDWPGYMRTLDALERLEADEAAKSKAQQLLEMAVAMRGDLKRRA
jgi:hypothetical protein